jgi:hypothetical protein
MAFASLPLIWLSAFHRFVVSWDRVVKIARRPAAAGRADNVLKFRLGATPIVLSPALATLKMHDALGRGGSAFRALDHWPISRRVPHRETELVLALSALPVVGGRAVSRIRP